MISTPTYELIHVRRMRVAGQSVQIATRKWEQAPLDTDGDFIVRVKREIGG